MRMYATIDSLMFIVKDFETDFRVVESMEELMRLRTRYIFNKDWKIVKDIGEYLIINIIDSDSCYEIVYSVVHRSLYELYEGLKSFMLGIE